MDHARDIFERYLAGRPLKHSQQRQAILDVFLAAEHHLTAEELHRLAKRRHPKIGFATVYRTLKLLRAAGLCRELKMEDGTARYEHLYGHAHHDHLICTRCGRYEEVVEPAIEALQEKLARRHGFTVERHRLELYGRCRQCQSKGKDPPRGGMGRAL